MPFSVFIPCKYLSADFVISNAKFFHFSRKATAACEANGYNFATYNVTMIQRDIPYETALAQCIESGDVAAGEI